MSPVAKITLFYIAWILAIPTIIGIPIMAVITIVYLIMVHERRAREALMVRNYLEHQNMLEVGRYFGGGQ